MKVTINKKKYELKYKLRIYFTFESITGYPFAFGKLVDEYLLFYSALLANNDGFKLEFDEFIDQCDKDPNLFVSFKEFFAKEMALQSQLLQSGNKKKVIAQA